MTLPRLAVTRPVTTMMMLVSILAIGGIAMLRMPLAFLPEVDAPFIVVEIPYPNSNPTQVDKLIVRPTEEALSTLAGVKKMSSNARADSAVFFLEFNWGQNLDIVRMQVSEKMSQVEPTLPSGIGDVAIHSFNTNTIPVLQGRISARGVDLSRNYDLLEARVINRIRRVPGVARVDLGGVEPREVRIDLVLDKVKEHGVDVGALIGRLRGASAKTVLGQVSHQGLRYSARALGAFSSLTAIESFPIDDRGLKLADVAEISYEEPVLRYGRHLDGEYAVALDVYKESTANTVDVVRAVTRVIEKDINNDPLLAGVHLFVWDDQGEQITNSVDGLRKAGLIGALLAVISLYLFLRRLDSTVIVALSIPFSIVAASGVMYFMGKTFNVLSMMGLMIGIGMLVDNAIVVLESIDRRHRTEPDTRKAALDGAGHVTTAVIASTFTTLIVFLPLIVGSATELTVWLKEIAVAICLALACSLFSSLTLIPLMSAHVLRERRSTPPRALTWLENRYAGVVAWTLRRRALTFSLLIATLAVGLAPFFTGLVKTAIFSGQVNDRIRLEYEFADFQYKSDAERAVNRIEEYLDANRERFDIASIYSYFTDNAATTTLNLSRRDLDDEEIKALQSSIREGLPVIPGVRAFFDRDSDEGGNTTNFAVKLYGQDSTVLRQLSEEAERRLATVAGVQDVTTPYRHGQREVQVSIDRERAYRLGLTAQDLSDMFAFTLGGMRLPRFNAGGHEVETWLALRLEDRENLADLKQITFSSRDDREVRIGDVATFAVVTREMTIARENRKARAAVRAVYEGDDWKSARTRISGLMDTMAMPGGYSWSWGDRIIEQDDQGAQMGVNVLLALVLVYLLMASLFESLAQPFAILFSIVFALPGAAWSLAATGTPFNLMAQIGLLILIGIVVNNGIVLLDHINRLRKDGADRIEAMVEGGRHRLRPILMTATTTIIGLLPLAIRGSTVGGLFYFPLARTVMGGLVSSSLLTLIFLPYVALGVEGFATGLKRLTALSRPRRAVDGAAPAPVPVD